MIRLTWATSQPSSAPRAPCPAPQRATPASSRRRAPRPKLLLRRSRRLIGLARRLYGGRGRVRVQFDKLRHVIIQRPLREGEHVVHVLLALVVDGRDSTKVLVVNTPCISLASSYLTQHAQVGNRGLRRHLDGRRLLTVLRHDKQRQKPVAGIRVHARDANKLAWSPLAEHLWCLVLPVGAACVC